jgi:hypothetical protein
VQGFCSRRKLRESAISTFLWMVSCSSTFFPCVSFPSFSCVHTCLCFFPVLLSPPSFVPPFYQFVSFSPFSFFPFDSIELVRLLWILRRLLRPLLMPIACVPAKSSVCSLSSELNAHSSPSSRSSA